MLISGMHCTACALSLTLFYWGLLCKDLRFETYPPVGTNFGGWYIWQKGKRTHSPSKYPPVGTFRNVTFYITDPCFYIFPVLDHVIISNGHSLRTQLTASPTKAPLKRPLMSLYQIRSGYHLN